jgi:hypothetical protein
MLKPQSIRKGMTIKINGREVLKQEIIDLSKEWTPNQETLFRKTLKQGGEVTIKGVHIKVNVPGEILNSKGEKAPAHFQVPGPDDRF